MHKIIPVYIKYHRATLLDDEAQLPWTTRNSRGNAVICVKLPDNNLNMQKFSNIYSEYQQFSAVCPGVHFNQIFTS